MSTFTIGQDCQAQITGPFGELQLPLETEFEVNPVMTGPSVKTITGIRETRTTFDSWSGMISFARADNTLDNFAQQFQDAFLSNGVIPDGSIYYTVREQDGSVSAYTLTGVQFHIALGAFKADEAVSQNLHFTAKKREQS